MLGALGLRSSLRRLVPMCRRLSDVRGGAASSQIFLNFSPRKGAQNLLPSPHVWWPNVGEHSVFDEYDVQAFPIHDDFLQRIGMPHEIDFNFDIETSVPPEEIPVIEAKKGKRTYQPNVLQRKRKHGFLSRLRTRGGRKVLKRRQRKGRWKIAVT